MSSPLQPHARLPCPSLSPGICSNSCPLSQCCHPNISSFCPQSFTAPESFPLSGFFTSCSQVIGASASESVLTMNNSRLISFRIDWFDLAVQGTLKDLLQHHSSKASTSLIYDPVLTSIHDYWKNRNFD